MTFEDNGSAPPRISCMIPTHERDEFLPRTIESILNQSLRPLEIIISDDTGSASTRQVVEQEASKSPIPIHYVDSSDSGYKTAGASRNAAAAHASGDFFAFLDDDDTWKPLFLESTYGALRAGDDMVVTWSEQVKGDHRWVSDQLRLGHTADSALSPPPGITGSNFLIRAATYRAIEGFDPRVRVFNDIDFLVNFLKHGHSYVVVESPLLERHVHDLGHLSTKSTRRAEALRYFYDKHHVNMSAAQRKELRRIIHAQLRIAHPSWIKRQYHLVAQFLLGSPLQPIIGISRRLRGEIFDNSETAK